jgi:hypothetical protein
MPNLRPRLEIAAALWDALREQPFEPFILRLHNGEALSIDNPDVLTVTLSGRILYDVGRGARTINALLITSIDSLPPATTPAE